MAITALTGMALIHAYDNAEADQQPRIRDAIRLAAEFVINDRNLNPIDRDEILWAQAYRVRFLARLSTDTRFTEGNQVLEQLTLAVRDLQNLQLNSGHWYHEYTNPFVTGTALCALYEAHQAGVAVDSAKVDSGLKALRGDRYANGAYPYSSRTTGSDNSTREGSVPASAGRALVCELARWYWKQATDSELSQAIDAAFEHHGLLQKALKYDDHTDTMAYGGFFFWYDMRVRSESIRWLSNSEARRNHAEVQRQLILSLPELDGCFVDSHELGRTYGTAMALLSLANLNEPALAR